METGRDAVLCDVKLRKQIQEKNMEQFLQVGVISSTHGIRGEVKVFPTTDDAARFKSLKQVILDTGKEHILMEIQGVKFFKQFVIVKFKGIDDINDVEKYKGKSLLVSREDAVSLEALKKSEADAKGNCPVMARLIVGKYSETAFSVKLRVPQSCLLYTSRCV